MKLFHFIQNMRYFTEARNSQQNLLIKLYLILEIITSAATIRQKFNTNVLQSYKVFFMILLFKCIDAICRR